MLEMLRPRAEHIGRWCIWAALVPILLNVTPRSALAQSWSWTFEKVDSGAKFTSLAVDSRGSVHVSYTDNASHVVKYAFRSVESSRWFTLVLDKNLGNATTRLTLDSQGYPHICYPDLTNLKYAYWNGKRWITQEISPGGAKEFTCSLAISSDGIPYVSWYQVRTANGSSYDHIRTAVLQDGAWLARTLDFDGEAGKWNSTVVDSQGRAFVSYSVFSTGELKVAQFNGKEWQVSLIDSLGRDSSKGVRGMGNCLSVDAHGKLHVSYFSNKELRYAEQQGDRWLVQKVDDVSPLGGWAGYLSSLGIDHAGHPHISYDDGSALKHAYWDGTRWHIQIVAPGGSEPYRYSSLGVGPDDMIYISYRDSQDGSLKVAVGRSTDMPSQAAAPVAPPDKN
jgi:hypothetical protein